jgi:putative transposase
MHKKICKHEPEVSDTFVFFLHSPCFFTLPVFQHSVVFNHALEEKSIYHIFNKGNREQILFSKRSHYLYFLQKVDKYIAPRCEILGWSLLPKRFNFLVFANQFSANELEKSLIPSQILTEGIRLLLSNYTKGFNKDMGFKGNLFRQKTRAVLTGNLFDPVDPCPSLSIPAFHYIHQLPWKTGEVQRPEDWEFSSLRDYLNYRNGSLCNKQLAFELLMLDPITLYKDTYESITEEVILDLHQRQTGVRHL